ncbi:hypothetical protein [Deinococcus sedimenti]|uniref:Uncharacterized protein n=1 Tax=Deinococcus sedimenti TaxID=1867090 RepID=A0ABQ2S1T5_9DEIO|nr:hypothetical protein [Deinococcus sedimenti]GGR83547.1 hypothetical protein GCM10008960_08270 [Deinococcus sedimenti]
MEYRYTLNLYGDGGVRAIRATVRNRSGSAYALKDQAGTYTFDRVTGTMRARADRDSDQLEAWIVAPGSYDRLSVNMTVFNFFRAVADGRGRQMLYGQ